MTTGPGPVRANGTVLRARASSIRRTTAGFLSVDARSIGMNRTSFADPLSSFSGSGNPFPRLKYSSTLFALARIASTPSYPFPFGEKLKTSQLVYSYTTSCAVGRRFRSDRRIEATSFSCAGAYLAISARTSASAERRTAADWVVVAGVGMT